MKLHRNYSVQELEHIARQYIDWQSQDDKAVNLTKFLTELNRLGYLLLRKNLGCEDNDFVEVCEEDFPEVIETSEPFQIWER